MIMRPTLEIKPETLSRWMKFIRFHPDLAERFMDCFWESQLTSKQNIISLLEDREMSVPQLLETRQPVAQRRPTHRSQIGGHALKLAVGIATPRYEE